MVDFRLRIVLQNKMFPRDTIEKSNTRFFKWVFDAKTKGQHVAKCENCFKPLPNYSAVYCSHILSRGAFPEMQYDARNINILCLNCHNEWENGEREKMRIFEENELLIEQLKKEYGARNSINY